MCCALLAWTSVQHPLKMTGVFAWPEATTLANIGEIGGFTQLAYGMASWIMCYVPAPIVVCGPLRRLGVEVKNYNANVD